jgi:CheY-like chemotaxis protein
MTYFLPASSDMNMPKLTGLERQKKIHTDPPSQMKGIPYLFFTTSASKPPVIDAYNMPAQVFFIEVHFIAEPEPTISVIIEYRKRCYAPNQYP